MKTKILLDGGDQSETIKVKELLGFLDGQTTNPSLFTKNPEVMALIAEGKKYNKAEALAEYKKIAEAISPHVGSAGVSLEVYADENSTSEELFAQGKEMYAWIPNAYVKYPITEAGLLAAQRSVEEEMRVNMTLCFSEEQAAAVYAATVGSKEPVYVSPFIGRLDDRGENGIDLIKNILALYRKGDGHVHVLAASIRSLEHLLLSLALEADLVTAPFKVLEEWATAGKPVPGIEYVEEYYAKHANLKTIPVRDLELSNDPLAYNIKHELTEQGVQKFVADYKSVVSEA
jgi:transaldolase